MAEVDVRKLAEKLSKQFKGSIVVGSDIPPVEKLSTGVDIIDIKTGGGLPFGRTIEIFGKESSGKSWLSYQLIKQAQARGIIPALVDAENAFDKEWVERMGVDLSRLIYLSPENAEEGIDIITRLLNENITNLIVLDSIDALAPDAEVNSSASNAQMAVKAKLINKALRVWTSRINVSKLEPKPMLVFINQLRDAMVLYGNPTTTPGGRGLKFYASIRLELNRGKRKEDSAGGKYQEVNFGVEKNKVGTPFKRGSYRLYVEDGLKPAGTYDDKEEIIAEAQVKGIINEGAWLNYKGEQYHGKTKLMEYFIANPDKYAEFLGEFYGQNGQQESGETLSEPTVG